MNENKIALYLKITNQETRDVFDIVYEHIKVAKRNDENYVWWGNNQNLNPDSLNIILESNVKPKALMFIPSSSGGNNNIMYTADIVSASHSIEKKSPVTKEWVPEYYRNSRHKTWLKLENFEDVSKGGEDVTDYFLCSSKEPLSEKSMYQYACGYVYEDIERSALEIDKVKEKGYLEGYKRHYYHKRIERNQSLVREAKADFIKKNGRLYCEICKFDFKEKYGDRVENFIEAHHKKQLSKFHGKETISKKEDLILLCSNCHSVIHAKKDDFTIEDLKSSYSK